MKRFLSILIFLSLALTASAQPTQVGGGGVSQIVAGSNVTVSPANGKGAVTINAVGGGVTKIVAGTNVTVSPGTGVGDVTINAAGGVVESAWTNLSGGTALTVNKRYYDSISSNRTITIADTPTDGQSILIKWSVTSTPTLTFGTGFTSVKRVGATNATVGSLALNPADAASVIVQMLLTYSTSDSTWYLVDSTSAVVNLSSQVTGVTAVSNGGTGASTPYGAFDNISGAEATIASAATCNIGAATTNKLLITGTTGITSFGTAPAGVQRWARFAGSLTLTYNATSMILTGGQNITTAAGDSIMAISLGSGNWFVDYRRANGRPVGSGGVLYTFGTTSFNPSNATKYYFSGVGGVASTSSGRYQVIAAYSGTIVAASIWARTTGTDSAAWTVGVTVQGGSQNDIASVSSASQDLVWTNASMNVAVTAGQLIEITTTTPTWSVARSNVVMGGYVLIK